MADNARRYGLRFYRSRHGSSEPQVMRGFAATAQAWSVNGGVQNTNLQKGDLIRRAATGAMILCDGAEGAGGALAPIGVVAGFGPYYNAALGQMQPTNQLPSAVAYGTNLERESTIWWIPVESAFWEIDCDDAVTATTLAAYKLLLGLNADHRHAGAAGIDASLGAQPLLDISTAAITATLIWRLEDVSTTLENADYSGNRVKLIVRANVYQAPEVNATGL